MLENLSPTDFAIGGAGVVVVIAYVVFLVLPAWASYGRWWEKIAASFLTLFMLATLLVLGGSLGLALVWSYDRWA